MPTERFYRLSDEKKKLIREAAFKEFARVPIDKVSINQIIKEADISRGSFYTYFEDKWDVLRYIFEESQAEVNSRCGLYLKESDGDIWFMLNRLLNKLLEMCADQQKFAFVKNVLSHASSEELFQGFPCKDGQACDPLESELMQTVFQNYNRSLIKPMDPEEFFSFFQLAMFSVAIEVKGYFEGKTKEELLKNFERKMAILQNGVCPVSDGGFIKNETA